MSEKNEIKKGVNKNVLQIMAAKYNLDPEKFKNIIKATIMKPGKTGRIATDEEFMAFLMVANKYDLDPFTNEIYAYLSKSGGIIPVVGLDGYVRKISNHPNFDGMEISFSEDIVTPTDGKPCPEWCEVKLYRKGVTRAVVVREYLDEVFRILTYANPWQTHTKRMLRHKTIIQAGRVAGFLVGVYDEDEAQRILEAQEVEPLKLESSKPEVQEPKPLDMAASKETPKEEAKANKDMTVGQLLEVPVGSKVESVVGMLVEVGVREKKGKMKDVVALYKVTDQDGNEIVISVWGKPLDIPELIVVKLTDVAVTEYNNERQYFCHGTVVRTDVIEGN